MTSALRLAQSEHLVPPLYIATERRTLVVLVKPVEPVRHYLSVGLDGEIG
jgi:hypothetical protein